MDVAQHVACRPPPTGLVSRRRLHTMTGGQEKFMKQSFMMLLVQVMLSTIQKDEIM
jgi:hypothetical protein